jgi:hypothetical protein
MEAGSKDFDKASRPGWFKGVSLPVEAVVSVFMKGSTLRGQSE